MIAPRTIMTTTSNEDDAVELDHGTANVPDTISCDIGGGPVVSQLDTVAIVDGTITFDDATTLVGTFGVIQVDAGALFLTISDTQITLDDKPVDGFQITNVQTTNFAGASQLTRDALQFICFRQGTVIETPTGPRLVERLKRGDLVATSDRGPQPVGWIGARLISVSQLERRPELAPISMARNARGAGEARRSLCGSGHHRILARGPVAARMFGVPEVLIAARHLIGMPGVARAELRSEIVYCHVMCAWHGVLIAEGAPLDSLFGGRQTLHMPEPRNRLVALKMLGGIASRPNQAARLLIEPKRGRRLVRRCLENGHPVMAELVEAQASRRVPNT